MMEYALFIVNGESGELGHPVHLDNKSGIYIIVNRESGEHGHPVHLDNKSGIYIIVNRKSGEHGHPVHLDNKSGIYIIVNRKSGEHGHHVHLDNKSGIYIIINRVGNTLAHKQKYKCSIQTEIDHPNNKNGIKCFYFRRKRDLSNHGGHGAHSNQFLHLGNQPFI